MKNKLLLFLGFILLLTSCQNEISSSQSTSSIETSISEDINTSSEVVTSLPITSSSEEVITSLPESSEPEGWVAPEEVWVPKWDFSPMIPYEGDYWDVLDLSLRGEELADAVRARILETFVGITYGEASFAVREMDNNPWEEDRVITIYDLLSHENQGLTQWNREHVFPQSKLADGDSSLRAEAGGPNISTDIANLFACDWLVNETKSNLSLGEWNYESDPEFYFDFLIRNSQGVLTDNILRRGNFSPSWQSRGETARSQLYMILMYPQRCGISENFTVETMLKWDLEVPRYEERDGQRQAGLEKYQNMRNPFIDIPELGCYIWGNENTQTRRVCNAILNPAE